MTDMKSSQRFEFGKNWQAFLRILDDERIGEAERSLKKMLKVEALEGKRFLDIGSGSGLFSLAARRMGANVHSFDYDPKSVACTGELKQRYIPGDAAWSVAQGDVLDERYLESLGQFDVVYSWGVLHHTGQMWRALDNIEPLVVRGGKLFISIYNRQTFLSTYWYFVKLCYNLLPPLGKNAMSMMFYSFFTVVLFWADIIRGRSPMDRHRGFKRRGMSMYHDVVDWIGGFPFEVALPEEVFRFCRDRGFLLMEMKTCAGKHGCNEFVFKKVDV